MSMTILTFFQMSIVCVLYMFVTCLLPMLLVDRLLPRLRVSEKVLLSVGAGNFFIINEVFLLQFLHISNRFTLVIGLVVSFLFAWERVRHMPPGSWAVKGGEQIRRLVKGEAGIKTLAMHLGRKAKSLFRRGLGYVRRHPLDGLLFGGVTLLILVIYMPNVLTNYGYCASDLPVHNDWINEMSRGKLFSDGVYPFGFHCVVYFLHAVFGVETYVILRVFGLVETLLVHWMLLFFLKAVLQSGILAYLGTAVYAASDLFQSYTYSRYASALPQEFGMIFILPAVYFGFAFFRTRKKWCLAGFIMSFGLTFAVHFYDTIIAGLFCVAMALGFAFRFFRRKYFLPIIGSVLVSLAVAAAPMAVALVSGTPPQASLDWALGVIYGDSSTGTGQTGSSAAAEESADIEASAETEIRGGDGKQNWEEAAAVSESMLEYVFRENASQYYPLAVFAGIALCLILAVIYLPLKDADRSGMLVTVAVFQVFVLILLAADRLGLPSLMDSGRTSIYCAYTIPVLWSFALDGLAGLPDRICFRPRISSAIALVLTAATVVCLVETDQVKQPLAVEALESNDAVTCLTNIIRDREDKTWTICSTSDELHMAEDYGYHYEMIEFLTGIENIGRYTGVTIPTEYVYFFVEKVPLDYYGTYEGSGQSVSAEGAMRELPMSTGSGAEYQTENRWIVMSRMYYWAEAFRQMYPENMTVYYETDTFICYQMNQNTERLFELGIDYGYNNYYG